MKLFAFIMAFIILAFSCMPCMDDVNNMGNSKVKMEISKSNDQQDHNDTDNCSPFCSCSCCSGFTFLVAAHQLVNAIFISTEKIEAHLPSKISEISLPVWQPPKLIA